MTRATLPYAAQSALPGLCARIKQAAATGKLFVEYHLENDHLPIQDVGNDNLRQPVI